MKKYIIEWDKVNGQSGYGYFSRNTIEEAIILMRRLANYEGTFLSSLYEIKNWSKFINEKEIASRRAIQRRGKTLVLREEFEAENEWDGAELSFNRMINWIYEDIR